MESAASSPASNMTSPPDDEAPAARFDDPAVGDEIEPPAPPVTDGPDPLALVVDAGLLANL